MEERLRIAPHLAIDEEADPTDLQNIFSWAVKLCGR